MRELRQKGKLMANIDTDGSIFVNEHFIGTLEGFRFIEDTAAFGGDSKILRAAADKILIEEIIKRAEELKLAEDGEFSLILGESLVRTTLNWRGIAVASLGKGASLLRPKITVIPSPLLQGDVLKTVAERLDRWLENHIGEILAPLFALEEAVNGAKNEEGNIAIEGTAKGIAVQIFEKLGTIPRRLIARDFRTVEREGRFQLKKLGIWLGSASLYIPSLLKPAPAQLRLLLWAIYNKQDTLPDLPPAGLCTISVDDKAPRVFYEISGYRVVGKNAVRLDMLERLANAAREVSLKGAFPASADLMSLVGTSGDSFTEIMSYLGYVQKEFSAEDAVKIEEKRAALLAEEMAKKAKNEEEAAKNAVKAQDAKAETDCAKEKDVAGEEVKAENYQVKESEPKVEEFEVKIGKDKVEVGKNKIKVGKTTDQVVKNNNQVGKDGSEVGKDEIKVKVSEVKIGDPNPNPNPEVEVKVKVAPIKEETAKEDDKKAEEPAEKIMLFIHQPYDARSVKRKGSQDHQKQGNYKNRTENKDSSRQGKPSSHSNKSSSYSNKNGEKSGKKGVKSFPKKKFVMDPDSPFAALAGLKAQLKKK